MTSKRWMRIAALLFAFTLVAAACGDDDDDVGTTDDGEATEAPTEATEATEAADGTADEAADDSTDGTASGTVEAAPTCTGEADGVLKFGTVLPETGSLAFLGPPEFAGADLAVIDINEAGGVLGAPVEIEQGDSGDTTTDIASQTVARHLENGVDVFVGAASSGVSFTFIDTLVENCKIHFSPANTSPDFTEYAEDGLYFRTAPSDVLQGRVLADLMINDGVATAAIIALQDPYGEGLLRFTSEPFTAAGGEVLEEFTYDPTADSFEAEVDRVVAADPDAWVLIGFEESVQLLTTAFEKGFTPDLKKIYLVDGNIGNALGDNFAAGQLAGIQGTLPGVEVTSDFQARMATVDPDLTDFSYGPETYDAVIISALAAEVAGSDDPAQIAARINGVTRDGEKCSTFADCKALIEAGTDIDYDGPSGPQTFGPAGEPTEATFGIFTYDDANICCPSLDRAAPSVAPIYQAAAI